MTPADAESLQGAAHAVEVYNEASAQYNDRADGWYLGDALLAEGTHLGAYAADDAHFEEAPDAFGAWVQVRSEALEPEPILAALKAGAYYSSQGPEIHGMAVGEGCLTVQCSAARAVFASGRG